MTFREYVDAVCYAGEECFSNKAAQTLLKNATRSDAQKWIESLPYRDYTRADRNIPQRIADEILSKYNEVSLNSYFEDLCDLHGYERFCEAFSKYCPEINAENAIDIAVKLFNEMLTSVIQENFHASSHNKESRLSDLQNIQALITQLQCTVENLVNTSIHVSTHKVFFKDTYNHWRNEFEQNYKIFLMQNMELRNYAVIYPELELIETIYNLSRTSKLSIRSECHADFHSEFYDVIIEYKCYLDQLLKIIHEK